MKVLCVGVLAAAFSVDTVATQNRVLIVGATTPTQELSIGASAEVVFAPRSAQTVQSATMTGNLSHLPYLPRPLPTSVVEQVLMMKALENKRGYNCRIN